MTFKAWRLPAGAIEKALIEANGSVDAAARALGCTRTPIDRHIRRNKAAENTRPPSDLGLSKADIVAAIIKHGSRADAARALGLNVNTVYKAAAEAIENGVIPARPAGRQKASKGAACST